jgi:hypothetical protein
LQGGLEFSEDTSAKWIFDVEIETLELRIFLKIEKIKFMICGEEKLLIDRLRTTFYNRSFENNILLLHFHISRIGFS